MAKQERRIRWQSLFANFFCFAFMIPFFLISTYFHTPNDNPLVSNQVLVGMFILIPCVLILCVIFGAIAKKNKFFIRLSIICLMLAGVITILLLVLLDSNGHIWGDYSRRTVAMAFVGISYLIYILAFALSLLITLSSFDLIKGKWPTILLIVIVLVSICDTWYLFQNGHVHGFPRTLIMVFLFSSIPGLIISTMIPIIYFFYQEKNENEGVALMSIGENELALPHLQKARRYDLAGEAAEKIGKYEESAFYYEKAGMWENAREMRQKEPIYLE